MAAEELRNARGLELLLRNPKNQQINEDFRNQMNEQLFSHLDKAKNIAEKYVEKMTKWLK